MNEQTAIELLKIANELMDFSATKFSTYLGNQVVNSSEKKPIPTDLTTAMFNECVKAVHDQFQQLTRIEPGK